MTMTNKNKEDVDLEASLPSSSSEAYYSNRNRTTISSSNTDASKSVISSTTSASSRTPQQPPPQQHPTKTKTTIHLTPTSSQSVASATRTSTNGGSTPTPNKSNVTNPRRSPLDLTLTSLFTSGTGAGTGGAGGGRSIISKENPYSDCSQTHRHEDSSSRHRPTSVIKEIDDGETSMGGITSCGFQINEISVPHHEQEHHAHNQCTNDDFTIIHMEDESTHAAPTVYKEDPVHALRREEAKIRASRRQMWMCFAMIAFLMVAGLSVALGIMVARNGRNDGTTSSNNNTNGMSTTTEGVLPPTQNNFSNNGSGGGVTTVGTGTNGGFDDGRLDGGVDDMSGNGNEDNAQNEMVDTTTTTTTNNSVGSSSSSSEMSPEQRETAIYNILSQISNPSLLQEGSGTPQRSAYEWIVNADPKQVLSSDLNVLTSRYVLAVLFYSLRGPNWFSSGRWLSNSDVCRWMGITCSSDINNPQITKLDLANLNLSGELPSELGTLNYLESLELQQNWFLKGTLPSSIGNLQALQEFTMYSTSVGGPLPDSIGNCIELRTLNLEGNQLSNQLPSTLGNLYQLEALNLSHNNLSGTISSNAFSGLVALTTLRLEGNNFEGSLPTGVCQLPYLSNIGRDCSLQCDCCSGSCV